MAAASIRFSLRWGKIGNNGLGNPYRGKTFNEVIDAMEEQVKKGKLEPKYTSPKSGSKSYKNKESGYSYNVDTGKSAKTGEQVEPPHVDVNYPNPKPSNVPKKKKLPIKYKNKISCYHSLLIKTLPKN